LVFVLGALAAVSSIHSDYLVVPLEGVSLAQEYASEDVHTLDSSAKQVDSDAKQPGEQKKEEQASAAKDASDAVKKAAAPADKQANDVSPPTGNSGGSMPDGHKNNEEQAPPAKNEEQAPLAKAASDAEPVHQKASSTPADPPEPEAMKGGDCAEGGGQGTNCECPDTPVAPRAAPTARPMAGPINEKTDDTDADGETCNRLRRLRKARGLDPVTGKALEQKATELGESVGVGMGDSVLQKSIEDGTALERFHTGYNALKFAYDHDTPEQQHALTQEIEENPDAYQEGNLRATFKSFSNLRSVSDEKATSMLRQEADTYLNTMP